MQQLTMFVNQIQPLFALYSDIIACLVAASVFSVFAGWMMHRSKARKQLTATVESWEKRYRALDDSARADAENLEEQLQSVAGEAKALQATNRVLTDSLKKNDTSIQKARAESIELNRQHAETQERLQRIIQQKDREILELGNRVNQSKVASVSTVHRKGPKIVNAPVAGTVSNTARRDDMAEPNYADTVAISSVESFDATVQMSAQELLTRPGTDSPGSLSDQDDTLESTADLSGMTPAEIETELEESTVALDEEALAFARRSSSSARRD
jgi:myosin heavy subunit